MPGTLAFAPTPEDLEDDLFTLPVLTFAPMPAPIAAHQTTGAAAPEDSPR